MAKYTTPQDYAHAEWPDADGVTRVAARHGFRDGLMAAREINDTYTVLAMVPISRVGNVADELAIVAWDPTGGHDGRGKAVSAWVRSLPARNWNHGEYFEDPADEPFQRVQRAVADMLRRAAWPIPASDDDI